MNRPTNAELDAMERGELEYRYVELINRWNDLMEKYLELREGVLKMIPEQVQKLVYDEWEGL